MGKKLDLEVEVKSLVEETYEMRLGHKELMSLLRLAGVELPESSCNVEFIVEVPGGGSWTEVDIDDNRTKLIVRWSTQRTEKRNPQVISIREPEC